MAGPCSGHPRGRVLSSCHFCHQPLAIKRNH
jgi:hypothetical protein